MNDSQQTPNKSVGASSINSFEQAVDPKQTLSSGSKADWLLWSLAVVLLIGSTLVARYLPQLFTLGQNPWLQGALTLVLVSIALVLMYATAQGKGFVTLVKDAAKERHKITWATGAETKQLTWVVLAIVVVIGIILALYDWLFNALIKLIV